MSFYRQLPDKKQIELTVRETPNSSKNQIVDVVEGALKIKLKAPPVDGEANEELIRFISKWLKVAKSDIILQKGSTSKNKKLLLPLDESVQNKLEELLQSYTK
jgi:uncharacterized protein (TIGR00251 family)